MKDYFAVLKLPRQPWLEEEAVKEAFHRLAREQHPDRAPGSTEQFSELTLAWKTLSDPVSRLRHWLELEDPQFSPSAQPPQELMDLFFELSRMRNDRQQIPSSGLSAVARSVQALKQQAMETRERELQDRIQSAWEKLCEQLRTGESQFDVLAAIHLRMVFLQKWRGAK